MRGILLGLAGAAAYAVAAALLVLGVALLFFGLSGWLHPAQVPAAWARTLAGVGLIGSSAGFAVLGRLSVAGAAGRQVIVSRTLKFAAVIGVLLALVCLPFAAAIEATAHAAWFSGAYSLPIRPDPGTRVSARGLPTSTSSLATRDHP